MPQIISSSGGSTRSEDIAAAFGETIPALNNYSVAAQTPTAATRTVLIGSTLSIPAVTRLELGTTLRWRWNMTKTAAGTAASTIDVAIGTAGTTADTAVLSFTKPAGTAAADEAWCELEVVIRGPLTASCIAVGEFTMGHNLAATGHAVIPFVAVNTVSGAFDATVASLKISVCLTSGASDAITIQQVSAIAVNI